MSTMTLRSNSRRNPFASTNTGNLNAAQDEQTAAPAKVESISQEQDEKVLAPDSEVPETPTLNTDSVEIESQGIPGRETSEAKEGNSFSDMSQSALDGSYSLEYNFDGHAPSDYDPTLGQLPWTSAQPRRRHSSSNRSVWSSSPVPQTVVQQAEESMQPEEQDLDVDEQRAALKSFKFLKEHSPEDSGNEQEDLTTEFEVSLAAVSNEDSEPVKHKKHKTKKFDSLVQTATGFNVAEAEAFGVDEPKPLPVQAIDHAAGYLLTFGINAALSKTITWLRSLGRNELTGKPLPSKNDPEILAVLENWKQADGFQNTGRRMKAIKHSAAFCTVRVYL
ncbi:hypothetical protein CPB85DRAFT_1459651 [Mucidula mucida]|nr:hypothetical protein CPB85DRAFT_1459651 [Mucidula mucida]